MQDDVLPGVGKDRSSSYSKGMGMRIRVCQASEKLCPPYSSSRD